MQRVIERRYGAIPRFRSGAGGYVVVVAGDERRHGVRGDDGGVAVHVFDEIVFADEGADVCPHIRVVQRWLLAVEGEIADIEARRSEEAEVAVVSDYEEAVGVDAVHDLNLAGLELDEARGG